MAIQRFTLPNSSLTFLTTGNRRGFGVSSFLPNEEAFYVNSEFQENPNLELSLKTAGLTYQSNTASYYAQIGRRNQRFDVSQHWSSGVVVKGYLVFIQTETNSRIEIKFNSGRPNAISSYTIDDEAQRTEVVNFINGLSSTDDIILEVWDTALPRDLDLTFGASATSTFTPSFTHIKVIKTIPIDPMFGRGVGTSFVPPIEIFIPEPPVPPQQLLWQELLHNALQHLPRFEQIPSLRERVFPDVIPVGQDYHKPHAVWYQTGTIQSTGMEGYIETGVRVTIDFRARDRLLVSRLRKAAISHLRSTGLIDRVINVTALYDFETKLRRELVDIIVYPILDPQKSRFTRLSPWSSPWGKQFG